MIIKTNGGIEHCSGDVARIVATGMEMGVAGVTKGQITPALDIIIYWAAIEGFGVDAGVPGIDYKGIATSQFSNPVILCFDGCYSVGVSLKVHDTALLDLRDNRSLQL